MTITDPNETIEAPFEIRIGDGVLTQPTWTNRGLDFETAGATVSGDGFADIFQEKNFKCIWLDRSTRRRCQLRNCWR